MNMSHTRLLLLTLLNTQHGRAHLLPHRIDIVIVAVPRIGLDKTSQTFCL